MIPDYYSPSAYEDYVNGVGEFFDVYAAAERRKEIEAERYDMYGDETEE